MKSPTSATGVVLNSYLISSYMLDKRYQMNFQSVDPILLDDDFHVYLIKKHQWNAEILLHLKHRDVELFQLHARTVKRIFLTASTLGQ